MIKPSFFFTNYNPLQAEFGSVRLISSYWNEGFVVSRYRKLTKRQSFESILLSGPSGSGKTSRFLLKQLYSLKGCSLLINDPQAELWLYASGYLQKHFQKVYSINFSDSTKSAGYNPFSRIKKPSDANKLADLLISATLDKGSGDVFWKLSSVNLTTILIRLLLHQPRELHNLANLIHLLQLFTIDSTKIDTLISKTLDEKLTSAYKEVISIPEKTLYNVIASVKSALQCFDNPDILRVTAFDTIDFEQLRKVPTAIFLHNAISDQRYISVLNSIFFEQFYAYALETLPVKSDLPIYLILEECGSSLYIPMLAQAVSTARKAKVGTYVVVQSHAQLKSQYKQDAETIKSNCRTKITLTGQTNIEELRELEALSGKRIYKDDKGVERTVPLIATDAIRMLPENRSLILSANHPLILAKSSPYYRSLWYGRFAKIPPMEFKRHITDGPISLITL